MLDLSVLIPLHIPLRNLGTPVVEAGMSGMHGCKGVLVPSLSQPGQLSVEWLTASENRPGRLSTGITHGTVLDVTERLGFLLAVDFLEQQGVNEIIYDEEQEIWTLESLRLFFNWSASIRKDHVIKVLLAGIKKCLDASEDSQ
jgi:hypothetical protein